MRYLIVLMALLTALSGCSKKSSVDPNTQTLANLTEVVESHGEALKQVDSDIKGLKEVDIETREEISKYIDKAWENSLSISAGPFSLKTGIAARPLEPEKRAGKIAAGGSSLQGSPQAIPTTFSQGESVLEKKLEDLDEKVDTILLLQTNPAQRSLMARATDYLQWELHDEFKEVYQVQNTRPSAKGIRSLAHRHVYFLGILLKVWIDKDHKRAYFTRIGGYLGRDVEVPNPTVIDNTVPWKQVRSTPFSYKGKSKQEVIDHVLGEKQRERTPTNDF